MNQQIVFPEWDIKTKLASASLLFRIFMKNKKVRL